MAELRISTIEELEERLDAKKARLAQLKELGMEYIGSKQIESWGNLNPGLDFFDKD